MQTLLSYLQRAVFGVVAATIGVAVSNVQAKSIEGVECQTPPTAHCGDSCGLEQLRVPGNITDEKTGRQYFLDFPCDLKGDEELIFVLNIHGAGSSGAWQRHYFPAIDYMDKYRLVVATPTAAGGGSIGGGQPRVRMWQSDSDDEHLHNIVDFVFEQFGKQNIKSFWLAGHSQGGLTSNRIVCTDFFKDKVDGWLSLSGGRIGAVQIPDGFFPRRDDSDVPAARPNTENLGGRPGAATTPTCDFSFIFTSGEHEMVSLPQDSPWAKKYNCDARVQKDDIVDTKAGYVSGGTRGNEPNKAWGIDARPGTANVHVYPNCDGNKLVADVIRIDKGHTEGLEPKVTEALIQMMASAPAGKVQKLK